MADHPLNAHIVAASTRAERETRDLIARLAGTCWPGGGADRTEPAARQWVRRWRPASALAALPTCSCVKGRCAVCN